MKSPTKPYKEMLGKLQHIRSIMSRVPQTECSSKRDILKVQSYILLAHAAIEEYLEELCLSASSYAVRIYNSDEIITKSLVAMVASETIAQVDESIPRKKIRSDVASNLKEFVNCAFGNIKTQITQNHGIRLANQRSLLIPIGIDPQECDSATSSALDAFGFKRGNIAHRVIINRTETRSSILSDVRTICSGLREFDKAACECLSIRMKQG